MKHALWKNTRKCTKIVMAMTKIVMAMTKIVTTMTKNETYSMEKYT